MWYALRPPLRYSRMGMKAWYKRLLGYLPVNWKDRPCVWAKEEQLPLAFVLLHTPRGEMFYRKFDTFKTYRP